MILVESQSKEKRTYKTNLGTKINYSFVPAVCTKIYQEYVKEFYKTQEKTIEYQKLISDEKVAKKMFEEEGYKEEKIDPLYNELKELSEYVNELGMSIIMYVLEKNKQEFEVSEDWVWENMMVEEMKEFIQIVCGIIDPTAKKK